MSTLAIILSLPFHVVPTSIYIFLYIFMRSEIINSSFHNFMG